MRRSVELSSLTHLGETHHDRGGGGGGGGGGGSCVVCLLRGESLSKKFHETCQQDILPMVLIRWVTKWVK